ncbi:MAG: hypothetical protein IPP74_08225 [Alphaproteobacteria bacterium]|nr:hypothetical protein [Alphaproteobacteria bacterium]
MQTQNMMQEVYTTEDLSHEQAIAELNRVKSEFASFVYSVSHDFQAPLRTMINFPQLLLERYQNEWDEKTSRYMRYIVDGSLEMKEMMDGLLLYSRLNTHIKPQLPIPLAQIIERACVALKPVIEKLSASLSIGPTSQWVYGDAERLQQVMICLIDNALKFQHEGTKPVVEINVSSLKDNICQVSVKDNGIGISETHQLEVFSIFRRLNKARQYPGIGIGLALVKKILDKHGQPIWIQSQLGSGSTFFFTLKSV